MVHKQVLSWCGLFCFQEISRNRTPKFIAHELTRSDLDQGKLGKQIPFEPHRDKTNKMACAPSEDSDQPGHPPRLIRVFAVRSLGS